jgi:small-conductance mechanosensitive channel
MASPDRMRGSLILMLLLVASAAFAAEPDAAKSPELEVSAAPVEVDGTVLFHVRGVEAYPAEKRAAAIARRIVALARDRAFRIDSLRVAESEIGTDVLAGNQRVVVVTDTDARAEGVSRRELAGAIGARIGEAIGEYRKARAPEALTRSLALTGAATSVFVLVMGVIVWGSRWIRTTLERRYRERIKGLGIGSLQLVRADRAWVWLGGAFGAIRAGFVLVAVFLYVEYVLSLFPSTRGPAKRVMGYVLDPIGTMAEGIVAEIPDLIFLAILFVVVRYVLRLVHMYFAALGRGEVVISGFDRNWAEPTYKLVRIGIFILALVVAYPYIPGSSSDAFKGISIFIGILFSLGSSSAIANIIAGYMMTYRRAFKVGDRVKIGEVVGDVTETRLQVTHVKTIKNEEVIIPNSSILNNEVMNYSSFARAGGLILHTDVGIGYGTPWRQVEAILLLAAQRTKGLMTEPAPFVRQKGLGEFAVTYELNAYCDNAQAMNALYADMHRNILDLFNEYGVQIMTPAYEGDPAEPKIVPKERWFAPPAPPA